MYVLGFVAIVATFVSAARGGANRCKETLILIAATRNDRNKALDAAKPLEKVNGLVVLVSYIETTLVGLTTTTKSQRLIPTGSCDSNPHTKSDVCDSLQWIFTPSAIQLTGCNKRKWEQELPKLAVLDIVSYKAHCAKPDIQIGGRSYSVRKMNTISDVTKYAVDIKSFCGGCEGPPSRLNEVIVTKYGKNVTVQGTTVYRQESKIDYKCKTDPKTLKNVTCVSGKWQEITCTKRAMNPPQSKAEETSKRRVYIGICIALMLVVNGAIAAMILVMRHKRKKYHNDPAVKALAKDDSLSLGWTERTNGL